jgi:hypothetical protein
MTIDQTDIVDFVSFEKTTGDVMLTISDHHDWSENEGNHLMLLQSKLNYYLAFIESGELADKFPKARGCEVVIKIMGKYPLSKMAAQFIEIASATIHNAGFKLQFNHFRPANIHKGAASQCNEERPGEK